MSAQGLDLVLHLAFILQNLQSIQKLLKCCVRVGNNGLHSVEESPDVQGKTLIFAVNDDHADLIVKILKEIYTEMGVDNDAIMKITGSVGGGDKKKEEGLVPRSC